MKLGKKTYGVIGIAVLGLIISPPAIDHLLVDERVKSYQAKINVTNVDANSSLDIGVDAGKNLNFGKVPKGTNVSKFLKIETEDSVYITVSSSGNISDLLHFQKSMIVRNNTRHKIEASTEKPGYYEGSVTFKFQTSKNNVGKKWLKIKSLFY